MEPVLNYFKRSVYSVGTNNERREFNIILWMKMRNVSANFWKWFKTSTFIAEKIRSAILILFARLPSHRNHLLNYSSCMTGGVCQRTFVLRVIRLLFQPPSHFHFKSCLLSFYEWVDFILRVCVSSVIQEFSNRLSQFLSKSSIFSCSVFTLPN